MSFHQETWETMIMDVIGVVQNLIVEFLAASCLNQASRVHDAVGKTEKTNSVLSGKIDFLRAKSREVTFLNFSHFFGLFISPNTFSQQHFRSWHYCCCVLHDALAEVAPRDTHLGGMCTAHCGKHLRRRPQCPCKPFTNSSDLMASTRWAPYDRYSCQL